jgi:hypothetical protein
MSRLGWPACQTRTWSNAAVDYFGEPPSQPARRVVVTGIGLVTPLGVGVENVWRRLLAGESGVRALKKEDLPEVPPAGARRSRPPLVGTAAAAAVAASIAAAAIATAAIDYLRCRTLAICSPPPHAGPPEVLRPAAVPGRGMRAPGGAGPLPLGGAGGLQAHRQVCQLRSVRCGRGARPSQRLCSSPCIYLCGSSSGIHPCRGTIARPAWRERRDAC